MAIYGLGLPAFVLQKILQPLFFAREDTRTPFRYAVAAMVVNAAAAIGLAPVLGWVAPAVAATLAGWAMVVLLVRGGRQFGDVARFDVRFRARIWRICLAAAIMGAVLWAAAAALEPALNTGGLRYLALAGLVGLGIVVYFATAHVIGAVRLSEFRRALRRGG